jgi:hypothetical protein
VCSRQVWLCAAGLCQKSTFTHTTRGHATKSLTVCNQMGVSYSTPDPLPPSLTPSTGLALTPRSLAHHRPDSYVEQWTASVQQALSSQTALTVTYLGAHGVHLFRRGYTNLIDPTINTRPLPRYPSEIDTKYNRVLRTSMHSYERESSL